MKADSPDRYPIDGEHSDVVPGLHWSLKRSFVDYVNHMPDGQSGVGAGAVATGPYEIVYPALQSGRRTTADGTKERFWEFGGDVRFKGHFGMLFVRIATPTIFVSGGAGWMSIADPLTGDGGDRNVLVDLTLEQRPAPEGLEVWQSTDVRLNAACVDLFNGVYPAGEPFEPLMLVMPVQ
jgi:hypothetical protein